ncbi:MAG TPA: hypothetical protein VK095_04785 [Beutenbergiaceae bacterium]|nr:hypothetical protein [Beutenbergiaceae bacterium]
MTGVVTPAGVVPMTVLAGKPDPAVVAPGLGAFLAFFALALVCVVLGFSMTRRVRRSERRQALRDEQEGQGRAAEQSEGGADGPEPAGDVEQTGNVEQTANVDSSGDVEQAGAANPAGAADPAGAANPAGTAGDPDTRGEQPASGPAARDAEQ